MHILKTQMTKFDAKSWLPIHTGPFLSLESESRAEFCKKHDFLLEEHSETKHAFRSQRRCKSLRARAILKDKKTGHRQQAYGEKAKERRVKFHHF